MISAKVTTIEVALNYFFHYRNEATRWELQRVTSFIALRTDANRQQQEIVFDEYIRYLLISSHAHTLSGHSESVVLVFVVVVVAVDIVVVIVLVAISPKPVESLWTTLDILPRVIVYRDAHSIRQASHNLEVRLFFISSVQMKNKLILGGGGDEVCCLEWELQHKQFRMVLVLAVIQLWVTLLLVPWLVFVSCMFRLAMLTGCFMNSKVCIDISPNWQTNGYAICSYVLFMIVLKTQCLLAKIGVCFTVEWVNPYSAVRNSTKIKRYAIIKVCSISI